MGPKKNLKKIIGYVTTVIILSLVFHTELTTKKAFENYLAVNYAEKSFKVGIPFYDLLYNRYNSKVTCLTDGKSFVISRILKTKHIYESYDFMIGTSDQRTSMMDFFNGSDVQKNIEDATGTGKKILNDGYSYVVVDIALSSKTDQTADIKKVLNVLKSKNVIISLLVVSFEKENNFYEYWTSSYEYNLAEQEIESRVEQKKEKHSQISPSAK